MGNTNLSIDPFDPPASDLNWGGRATRAEINLDALIHNFHTLQKYANGATVMPIVKSNAYGHGALSVAQELVQAGASWLGVYTVDEGAQLRRAGVRARILVLGPFTAGEADAAFSAELTMTVTSADAAQVLQCSALGRHVAVHVKIDSGLARAGVVPEEAPALVDYVSRIPELDLEGIYTHFACADVQDNPTTLRQLKVFLDTVDIIESRGHRFELKHAANSAGTLNFPPTHLDLVRTGIALYGENPTSHAVNGMLLRPALSLLSAVARVQKVPAGTGVGYGHDHVCPQASTIALIPVGYGDGFSRGHGNAQSRVLIEGQWATIVGRVSMDQITVDVTGIDGLGVGSEVVLIGTQGSRHQTAGDLARDVDTISYEVLASIMPRVPRLYVRNGRIAGVSDLTSTRLDVRSSQSG